MMREKKNMVRKHDHDGVDRRGFLRCMAWAGTGALCVIKGGVLRSYSLSDPEPVVGRLTHCPPVGPRWSLAAPLPPQFRCASRRNELYSLVSRDHS